MSGLRGHLHRGVARLRTNRGQAFVEFALLLPVFVLLVAALLQAGIYFYRQVTLNDALRAAARAAITCRVSTGVAPGTVGNNAANGLAITWSINGGGGSCPAPVTSGQTLSVSGTASMGNLGFPILASIFPSTATKTVQVVAE